MALSTPVWFSVNPLLRPPSLWLLKTMGAQRQLLLKDSLSFQANKDDICNCFIAHTNCWLLLLGCSAWWKNKRIVWMFRPRLRQPLSTQKHWGGGSAGELNTQDEGEGRGRRKGRRHWLLHHLQGERLLRVEHHGDLVDQVDVCGAWTPLVHRQVGQVLAGVSKASRSSPWSP